MLSLLPTDTCYGLAGNFTQEDFDAINVIKGRDDAKRLALLVEDFDDIYKYVIITDEQMDFLKNYPYPWSFLGVKSTAFQLPDWMDAKKYEKISIRVAKVCIENCEMRMKGFIYPLFLTSANLSGQPESTTFEEAKNIFPGIDGIDGGVCNKLPSDIFSMNEEGELHFLRRNYGLN